MKADEVADILGIPDTVTQAALPGRLHDRHRIQPAARPPVETITSWNTWDVH